MTPLNWVLYALSWPLLHIVFWRQNGEERWLSGLFGIVMPLAMACGFYSRWPHPGASLAIGLITYALITGMAIFDRCDRT